MLVLLPGSRARPQTLRRSLVASLQEGFAAELVGACGSSAVLTAWALYLRLSPASVGMLGALPFVAQAAQLPGAFLTGFLGSRRAALWFVSASRQVPLLLALLPWLPLGDAGRRALLLGVAGGTALLGVLGNNAWTSWMGDLVPDRIRGRYFGRRSGICAIGGAVGALGAGLALDQVRGGPRAGLMLSLVTLCGCAVGGLSAVLLARQHQPHPRGRRAGDANPGSPARRLPRLSSALEPLRDARMRRLLAFQIAWSLASGLGAAFYPLYMIGTLRMAYAQLALYTTGLAIARLVSAPLWGRAIDRLGAKPVLVATAFGLALSPLVWMFPREHRLWPLALDALLCGVLLAGQSLGAFSLTLSATGGERRGFHLAAYASAGGLCLGLGSVVGGALIARLPPHLSLLGQGLVAAQLLFLCGGALRLCAAGLALRLNEPGSVRALGVLALRGARERLPALDPRPPVRAAHHLLRQRWDRAMGEDSALREEPPQVTRRR